MKDYINKMLDDGGLDKKDKLSLLNEWHGKLSVKTMSVISSKQDIADVVEIMNHIEEAINLINSD